MICSGTACLSNRPNSQKSRYKSYLQRSNYKAAVVLSSLARHHAGPQSHSAYARNAGSEFRRSEIVHCM